MKQGSTAHDSWHPTLEATLASVQPALLLLDLLLLLLMH
jgi:hypothetical protein